jgi:hypothetical protein
MRWNSLGVLVSFALVLAACGAEDTGSGVGDDEAVLQITSEGGFLPVEVALGNGPRYTVLGDGRLIFQGAQIMIFPGPLVPPYMVAQLDDGQMNAVLAMVEDIGLPEIDDEADDSAADMVADASTEVISFWDENGEHRLSVYALGIEDSPSDRNAAFLELIETFDRFTAEATAEPYEAVRVRLLAGNSFSVDPEFEDVRPWPLEDTDLDSWDTLPNGWVCTSASGTVPDLFDDATQATTWEPPSEASATDPLQLLVRPLLPGETDCL